MLALFQQHIRAHLSFLAEKKLLVAASGGIDSMVLCELLRCSGLSFGLAHCNFGLRACESDADAEFVREYANKHELPFHLVHFDTTAFALDQGFSLQVAARELRYRWFNELMDSDGYQWTLTAHHADDKLETFLINLSRGTGIDGLMGIPLVNGRIARPLLPFSREQLLAFAEEKRIRWREDRSNASDQYLRNKIRHHIVPLFKELNPNLLTGFDATLSHLEMTRSLADDASRIVYRKIVAEGPDEKRIHLSELKLLPNFRAYLYEWLSPFGFTSWPDIYDLVEAQSGKKILAPGFILLKDREVLILKAESDSAGLNAYLIPENATSVEVPLNLRFTETAGAPESSNTHIFVDRLKLRFPLLLRKWKPGDRFWPAGMKGKSKKVSKFFKDEKLSLFEKENTWLLCSDDQIVWIVGRRQDERFKAKQTTHNTLKITLIP